MKLEVEMGTVVTLHFALVLEDGDVIDSNFEAEPATFTVGDGNLLPGFETTLMGLVNGDEREFTISPGDAFGQHNPHSSVRQLENPSQISRLVTRHCQSGPLMQDMSQYGPAKGFGYSVPQASF